MYVTSCIDGMNICVCLCVRAMTRNSNLKQCIETSQGRLLQHSPYHSVFREYVTYGNGEVTSTSKTSCACTKKKNRFKMYPSKFFALFSPWIEA